ncbi:MAG: hypothetical protein MHMPM18_004006 [Marteilia pararefringens]
MQLKSTSDIQSLLEKLKADDSGSLSAKKTSIIYQLEASRDDNNSKEISLLIYQVDNSDIQTNRQRYSPRAKVIYMRMFLYSLKLYSLLNDFKILSIPSADNLRNIF